MMSNGWFINLVAKKQWRMTENYFSPITTYDTEIASSITFYSTFFFSDELHFLMLRCHFAILQHLYLRFTCNGASSSFFFPPCSKLFTTAALETKIQTESCFYWGEHPIARRRRQEVFSDPIILKVPSIRFCSSDFLDIWNYLTPL